MNAFIVNCKPNNWEACNKYTIFGLKEGIRFPPLTKGDLILFRISGPNYGVKALWYFEYAKKIIDQSKFPLSDANYVWILNCKKIITFKQHFSEDFQTSSKKSSKIAELYAGGIQRAIVEIKEPQLKDYILNILKECADELNISSNYLGEDVNVNVFLQKILTQLGVTAPYPKIEKNEIVEPILKQQEYKDKPTVEQKEDVNESIVEQLEVVDKSIVEQQAEVDESIVEHQEDFDESIIEHQKEVDEFILEHQEEVEESIVEHQENVEKSVVEHQKEVDESVVEHQKEVDESIVEHQKNVEKPVVEHQEEVDESIVKQPGALDKSENEVPSKSSKQSLYETIGERINLPILNYAPLNERGVILLFGHYLQDLGISHIEEIREGFPDAIAVRSIGNGKYQRVRIEFEYKSSSFLKDGHDKNECDLIVCWKHDWDSCPIEVIELSTVLFDK